MKSLGNMWKFTKAKITRQFLAIYFKNDTQWILVFQVTTFRFYEYQRKLFSSNTFHYIRKFYILPKGKTNSFQTKTCEAIELQDC